MDANQVLSILLWFTQIITALVVLIYTFVMKHEEYHQLKRQARTRREHRSRQRQRLPHAQSQKK